MWTPRRQVAEVRGVAHGDVEDLAEADLIDIWLSTYDRWGEQQAEEYFDDLQTQIKTIAVNAEIGSARNEIRSGYRSLPVGGTLFSTR